MSASAAAGTGSTGGMNERQSVRPSPLGDGAAPLALAELYSLVTTRNRPRVTSIIAAFEQGERT